MHFTAYSSKQIDKLIDNDAVYERLQEVLSQDTDDMVDLKKIAKVTIKEFGLSYTEWDKVMFLLKLAKSCHD